MFKLIGKEINAILGALDILIWTYVSEKTVENLTPMPGPATIISYKTIGHV